MAEALQNKKLGSIADAIAEKSEKTKVILIAGPSSSGKTTTAKIIRTTQGDGIQAYPYRTR